MESRLDGSLADPQRGGDGRHRQVEAVPKRDEDLVVGLQPNDGVVDGASGDDPIGDVRGSGAVDPGQVETDRGHPPPAFRPEAIAAAVDEDPLEPVVGASRVAELGPVAPRSEGRIVDDILGLARIAEDEGREAVGLVEAAFHEAFELGGAGIQGVSPRGAALRAEPLCHQASDDHSCPPRST